MAPKKDKKKDKKQHKDGDGSSSSIDTSSIPLLRPPFPSASQPTKVHPLPQRFAPNPIDMFNLLPEWQDDLIMDESLWEPADVDNTNAPYASGPFALPSHLTSKSNEPIVWKRAG